MISWSRFVVASAVSALASLSATGCAGASRRPSIAPVGTAVAPAPDSALNGPVTATVVGKAASRPAPSASDANSGADRDKTENEREEDGEGDVEREEDGEGAFDDTEAPGERVRPPHPLAGVSDAEIERRVVSKPASLGSMSIGKTNAGLLFNGVQMPPGDAWTVVAPGQAYATQETVDYLETAIHVVTSKFPNSPKLAIGDISGPHGGHLTPHLSHQAGRDVDISYYYLDGQRWYRRATAANLDVARTWAFVRALITQTDVKMLFIDRSIQKLLRAEAERIGEDSAWLDAVFRGRPGLPPIIRHAPGHATHLHIRFYNPISSETGRRAYAALLEHHLIHVGPVYAVHVAKRGDTLGKLAKRYHTTVRRIRRANGLRSNLILAKRSYRIPQPGHAPPSFARGPVTIPKRRLPPEKPPRGETEKTAQQ